MSDDASQALRLLSDDDPGLISGRLAMMAIMRKMGGPEGFAQFIVEDLMCTEPGSPARIGLESKLLQALFNLNVDDATESASEEELMTMVKKMVAEDPAILETVKGDTHEDA